MFSCGHHTAIFIVSIFMLLLLKDLLAKFIITSTLKDKLTSGCVSSKVTLQVSTIWLVSRLSTRYALE
jgi:hypothetical protein